MQTDAPQPPQSGVRHNIVLFGETGAGKSSIINMLRSSNEATISSGASGCTLSSTGYTGTIQGQAYTFWDTAGMNESDVGKVPDMQAVIAFYHLLHKLKGGVSLLVFCMKAPRITEAGRKNWDLFRNLMCHGKVPAVVAVTYLDQEDMEAWWDANKKDFEKSGIHPTQVVWRQYTGTPDGEVDAPKSDIGVACITATKGKLRKGQYVLEEEYEQSCWKMKKLVYESHLSEPWKAEPMKWFQEAVREGVYKLMERWGIKSEAEAMEVAKTIEQGVE